MTTHQPIMQFDFSTSGEKYTLKGLKQPKELFHTLQKRGFGLGIVSGTDMAEIRKTLEAIAAEYTSYRGKALELRTGDTEPLPGAASMKAKDFFSGAKRIMRRGHNSYLVVTGELNTPEALEVVTKYTSEGGLVIAPIIASSAKEAFATLCEIGKDTAPFSFANSFTYIAQQTLIEDPFDVAGGIVSSIDITVVDDKMRNDLVRFKA